MQNIQSQSRQSGYYKAYVITNKQPMDDTDAKAIIDKLTICLTEVAENRDRQAYAMLFGYFAPKILNFGNQKLANQGLATDLVQETMTNVWTKAHLFNAEKGSITTWVFTIMRNRCFDMLRKVQHNKEDTFADDIWPVFETAVAEEHPDHILTAKLLKHVDALPLGQRQVVKGVYLHELSQQELASKLDVPLGTIKSRLRLGLVKLRSILEKDYD
ncbi:MULTISPECIES: sigma-70 family RNA polymerase sigma factor [unclassified Shewanella]|uniref:sigma-70 family RNA polymerase sigma factor n=1 Tax=unclassified Shewanella TaxID=196818 RepID=UPI001BC77515|nr:MULTISPECIES: sigma-70 family RNA polymerase sigma factor [unclassified Shewanella]GIU07553.1 RNA polymerase sigma factor ECF family 11 [Shewanella sp. MBTL60-112-B1]GIU30145.1 RNA polymerase sigma factor ECF family 11 [Shewanella sp. MBTL60-112-B2]